MRAALDSLDLVAEHLAAGVVIVCAAGKTVAALLYPQRDGVQKAASVPIKVAHQKRLVAGRLEVAGTRSRCSGLCDARESRWRPVWFERDSS